MEKFRLDNSLDNQVKFIEYMLEHNNVEILAAIKESLLELKRIKGEQDKKGEQTNM
ncbi:MAG: hypothetical protein RLZ10_201 [Bacteroidota bacterium]|jgi:hypothetical protein